ncbi:acyloxyacyl hydrolase [Pelagibacteraceae bacterium]|nr:acyloxyacyl hydrolase [Pelagibacteraceae bacterium]
MRFLFIIIVSLFFSNFTYGSGLNVYGVGIYDIKFDGSEDDQTLDFRYERRFDKTLFDIGPEEDNFFFLKPFIGLEYTGDSASYFLTGIYLEDNLGELTSGKENNYLFTPSFGIGYYDDGSGKKLGNEIQFRTTLEFSYELENKNRIAISFGHISNANLGDKNPGVEILSLNYQIPY